MDRAPRRSDDPRLRPAVGRRDGRRHPRHGQRAARHPLCHRATGRLAQPDCAGPGAALAGARRGADRAGCPAPRGGRRDPVGRGRRVAPARGWRRAHDRGRGARRRRVRHGVRGRAAPGPLAAARSSSPWRSCGASTRSPRGRSGGSCRSTRSGATCTAGCSSGSRCSGSSSSPPAAAARCCGGPSWALAAAAVPARHLRRARHPGLLPRGARQRGRRPGSDLWAAPDLGNPLDLAMLAAAAVLLGMCVRRGLPLWEWLATAGLRRRDADDGAQRRLARAVHRAGGRRAPARRERRRAVGSRARVVVAGRRCGCGRVARRVRLAAGPPR